MTLPQAQVGLHLGAGRDASRWWWVGVNTALPNRLLRATIEAGLLEPWLGPVASVRAEVTYGRERRSRIDLLLQPAPEANDQRPIYVEIKNTTWSARI